MAEGPRGWGGVEGLEAETKKEVYLKSASAFGSFYQIPVLLLRKTVPMWVGGLALARALSDPSPPPGGGGGGWLAWPVSPVAIGYQGNPCSKGIRWGVSPTAQMGCLRNRSGSPSGADQP